jgi:hypothetical protein
LDRFYWLDLALPDAALARQLETLSREADAPLAWFFWFERGDDLYADAAWLIRPSASGGHVLYGRQTYLMGREEGRAYLQGPPAKGQAWEGSPLHEAMRHLGVTSHTEYFVPADQRRFNWESHRLRDE